jgi:Na+/H+ antiporter NhaC
MAIILYNRRFYIFCRVIYHAYHHGHADQGEMIKHSLLDSFLLTVLVFHVLYFFLLKPMILHMRDHKQAEENLKQSSQVAIRMTRSWLILRITALKVS